MSITSENATNIKNELPCFVYYWKKKNDGRVQRIGYAEHMVGSNVMIRESSYSRDMYNIKDLEIIKEK